jgi:hypothetical protein
MALVESTTTNSGFSKKERIRVAIRVRPLLPHEQHKDEVVYYPNKDEGALQVKQSPKTDPFFLLSSCKTDFGLDHLSG